MNKKNIYIIAGVLAVLLLGAIAFGVKQVASLKQDLAAANDEKEQLRLTNEQLALSNEYDAINAEFAQYELSLIHI